MSRIHKWSSSQRALMLVAFTVVATITIFALGEAVVRVRHRIKFGSLWGIEQTYTVDAQSGLRIPIPGGNFGGIHINSRGFRGPEIDVPKPASTVRVAFLGSSTTYCAEVSNNENTWPQLVTERLQSDWSPLKVDYVNGGVPGYTVRSSLRNLETRVAALEPDIIVIYEGHNDISGNALDLAVKQGVASRPTEEGLSWPSKYSLLWYLVEKNLRILQHERTATQTAGKLVLEGDTLVRPYRSDLRTLVQASQKVARLVVVITLSPQFRREQTSEQQVHAAKTSLYYMPFVSIQDLIRAYDSYNAAVTEVAHETGALLVADENSIPGDPAYFADSVHFTDKGSHLMAERVVQAVRKSERAQELVASKKAANVAGLRQPARDGGL